MWRYYAVTGAVFFLRVPFFSAGGCRSLFFKLAITMVVTNFFSPCSSNWITMRSSVLDLTVPRPNFWCSTWAPWLKLLEAMNYLRFSPRMNCRGGRDRMTHWLLHHSKSSANPQCRCKSGKSGLFSTTHGLLPQTFPGPCERTPNRALHMRL